VVLAKIFQNAVLVDGAANPAANVVLAAVNVRVFLEFVMVNVVACTDGPVVKKIAVAPLV
jgi:hypothetical protein